MGIEPISSAWKADALAVVLQAHGNGMPAPYHAIMPAFKSSLVHPSGSTRNDPAPFLFRPRQVRSEHTQETGSP